MRVSRAFLISLLVCGLMYRADRSTACGPFFTPALFTLTRRPDPPLERFAQGRLGVLSPTYKPAYLVIAYRYLSGSKLDGEEQAAVLSTWQDPNRSSPETTSSGNAWKSDWLEARKLVPGVRPAREWIQTFREASEPNNYMWYYNCAEDSFRTAGQTLRDRIAKYRAESPRVKAWVEAQDQVFENCSKGRVIPAALTSATDPLEQADRVYQIAAAHFYAEDFEEAAAAFRAIASDRASPWRQMAPYLAVRAMVRKATLSAGPGLADKAILGQAERELNVILTDNTATAIHPAARRLLDLVRFRLYPERRLQEIADALMKKSASSDLGQNLRDYTLLLRRMKLDRPDDMTDWVLTLPREDPAALEHCLARWKETSSPAWLVASLARIPAGDRRRPEIVASAAKIASDSPAYLTVKYHALRLAVESGEAAQARLRLDGLLRENAKDLTVSSRNLFLSLRLKTAQNLDEFTKDSTREIAGYSYDDPSDETPGNPPSGFATAPEARAMITLDEDAAQIINAGLPLKDMARMAKYENLPENIRRDLTQAVWTRAILLQDSAKARQIEPLLGELIPELRSPLEMLDRISTSADREFAAALVLLQFPGLRPYVTSGFGRRTPIGQLDDLRENWWCAFSRDVRLDTPNYFKRYFFEGPGNAVQAGALRKITAPFLGAEERKVARAEWEKLSSLGAAPNYLAQRVLAWGRTHPGDPRVPEALHRVVRAARLGCRDRETSRYSRAAFQLLHQRYAQSEWAKKTKYWY